MQEPTGGRRALLYFSFVLWFVIVGARFLETGDARKARVPAANPILAGVSDKLLDVAGYTDQLQKDPQYTVLANLHPGDQLQSAAEEELTQALLEAPHDVVARCKLVILAATMKHDAKVRTLLDDALKDTDQQPDFQPLVHVLEWLYGSPAQKKAAREAVRSMADAEYADAAVGVVTSNLTGWFRNQALMALYDSAHLKDQAAAVAKDQAQHSERACYTFFGAGIIILCNFVVGCILLFLLPFFHHVGDLRSEENQPAWWWGNGWMVYVWFMIAEILVGLVFLLATRNKGQSEALSIPAVVGVQFIVYAVSLAGVVYLVRSTANASWAQLGIHAKHMGRCILLGLGSYLCALPCIVLTGIIMAKVMSHVPTSTNGVFSLFAHAPTGLGLIALLALVCIVGPLVEEIVFRGVLYSSLRQVLKPWQAMVLSAAIFSLVHADLPAFLPIFILALFMAFVFEKTGSLVPSFVMHMLQNSTTFLFTLFLVS